MLAPIEGAIHLTFPLTRISPTHTRGITKRMLTHGFMDKCEEIYVYLVCVGEILTSKPKGRRESNSHGPESYVSRLALCKAVRIAG